MPKLQVLQNKYGKTGKFQIVLSHVQGENKKGIDSLLSKNKVTFPSYQQLRLKKHQGGRGIPHMILFDHEGNKIVDGKIEDLEKQIAKLVKAAPDPADMSPLYADVSVKHNKREVAGLKPGRSVKSALSALERKAKKTDPAGIEAAEIVKAVYAWGEKELSDATAQLEVMPTTAYARLVTLNKTFYGMPLVKGLSQKLTPYMRDKYFKYLAGLGNQLARLKADTKRRQSSKDSLVRTYQNFIDKYPASDQLKNEAAEIIKQIQALPAK